MPGFALKFWTITSWMWPCSRCRAAIASSASIRSARVSPIPIRIPVVNGIASSPASRIVSRRAAGRLSGEPKCGPPRSESRSAAVSSMSPCDAVTSRSAASSSRVSTPGLACGSRPVSSSTSAAHAHEVLDRRLATERGQLLAGDAVAALRLVAEREQRLRAAGGGAGAGDVEHLVGRQVRALAAARRTRERAVVTDVPAQLRQRDEDLRRVGDERAPAQAPGLGEQVLEGPVEHMVSIRPGGRLAGWTPTCWCR